MSGYDHHKGLGKHLFYAITIAINWALAIINVTLMAVNGIAVVPILALVLAIGLIVLSYKEIRNGRY